MGHVRSARRTIAAGALALGLTLSACAGDGGGSASIETSEDVVDAVLETFGGSFVATQSMELDLDADTLRSLLELDPEFTDQDAEELAFMEAWLEDTLSSTQDASARFARAEDGSLQFASLQGDDVVYDLRLDLAELLRAETLTPEAGVLLKVDLDAVFEQFTSAFESLPEEAGAPAIPSADELRAQADAFLPPGPLGDTARAILDGEFGGILGTVDLAAFGATEDDLAEFRASMDTFLGDAEQAELLADAYRSAVVSGIGIGETSTADGRTTVSVDVLPRAAMQGIIEFLEDNRDTILEIDPDADLPEDLTADFEDEFGIAVDDLPETIPAVVELAFDGDGRLVHVEMDLVAVAAKVVDVLPDAPAEAGQVIEQLRDATATLFVDLSDFGDVSTVMDVDATTIEWADITGLMGMMG